MYIIQRIDRTDAILFMYQLVASGDTIGPRGLECRNVRDLAISLHMSQGIVITNFVHRRLNLQYAKREWLWYLGADPFDDSIQNYASMWKKLKQPDGSFYSNYGQYIFGQPVVKSPFDSAPISQFQYVVERLARDRDSRRASMVLLRPDHLFHDNVDVVCTYAINFSIGHDRLNMTVMMRSNDVIFGFTNDAFCFSNLYLFVYTLLLQHYPDLKLGDYTHFTNSMHVYAHHYEMVDNILEQGRAGYTHLDTPTPTLDEVIRLVESRGKDLRGEYSEWLTT